MAYGEWLPKFVPAFDSFEDGDIIAYDNDNGVVGYRKANEDDKFIIGVADTSAVALSGKVPYNEDYYDERGDEIEFKTEEDKLLYGHIPTALNGIVSVKFKGESRIGGYVVMSDVPGVARMREEDDDLISFGKILKDPINDTMDMDEVRSIQVLLLDNEIMKEMTLLKTTNLEMTEVLNFLLMGDDDFEEMD